MKYHGHEIRICDQDGLRGVASYRNVFQQNLKKFTYYHQIGHSSDKQFKISEQNIPNVEIYQNCIVFYIFY